LGKPVCISDSIVWDFLLDPSLKGGLEIQWLTFIGSCCLLQQLMFKHGLPLRGGISYGEYYIEGNCLAGRPVVEAFDLCNKIQLVGCGLTLQAEKELPRSRVGGIDAFGAVLTNYAVPLKGMKPQHMKLLNWAFPGGSLLEPLGENFREQIIEAFLSHGKQIPTEVYEKVNNTEAFFRHCRDAKSAWDKENPPPAK
jgi:hypothetical protein